jgi:hypothetical protein
MRLTPDIQQIGLVNRLVPYPSSLEEVIVCVGYKVLVEVDDNSTLIFGIPVGILGH